MKTAYELAMERLNQTAPMPKLSAAQKRQMAELDSRYAAKIAEREIALTNELAQAQVRGDFEQYEKLQQQLAEERKALQAEREAKKDQVRQGRE